MSSQRVRRELMLDPERLKYLSTRSSKRVAFSIIADYLIIGAAILLTEVFFSIPMYVIAVLLIGGRQIGLGAIALHDGTHGMLSRNKGRNDRIARIVSRTVLVFLLGMNFKDYRENHLVHHRNLNTHDDPDWAFYIHWHDSSRIRRFTTLLAAISGAMFLWSTWGAIARLSLARKMLFFILVLALILLALLDFHPARVFLMYWIVPLATWGFFINYVRAASEHFPGEFLGNGEIEIFQTRDIRTSWFDRVFVATRGTNFHLTHHLFPTIPFFHLEEAHRNIRKTAPYARAAHEVNGYHRVILELVLGRPFRG